MSIPRFLEAGKKAGVSLSLTPAAFPDYSINPESEFLLTIA
jgi:hypothetical protein